MTQTRFRLYQGADLAAVIDAMARQALALVDDTPTVLVGVLRRGAPLADRLAERLRALRPQLDLRRTDLKVKRYGDDLSLLHPQTSLEPTPEQDACDYAGHRLIVVDDVLYQGYSAFRVLEFLRSHGAQSVHLAVLVDRCCVRVPVGADIVGLRLQIAPGDVIECNVPPYEDDFAIDLLRLPGAG
jgi:pyrimidine operon attenuation protein/uracil phosphoribosyltransferase